MTCHRQDREADMKAWRVPFVVGSISRLAYGVGAMAAPERMAGRLAPTLRDHPDPRMNLRGFGGAQSGVALYTLVEATTPERARPILTLNALVDPFDALVSLAEWRARGRLERVVVGGIAVNVASLLCWSAAAAALRKSV